MGTVLKQLTADGVTAEAFQPYGQVILPRTDGDRHGPEDAQLVLDRGTPRFYLMRLFNQGRQFHHITRHQQCTQCLGSLANQPWWIAVAPPSLENQPILSEIVAFHIPGDRFIKLEVGTWHSGPYFDEPFVDFYNLELTDTNIMDHQTCDLMVTYGVTFELV